MTDKKKNANAVSNEEIIAALLQNGSIKAAAGALGSSPRMIYSRMNEKEFISLYTAAKTDIFRNAVFTVNARLSAAIDTVTEIMESEETNPATRLQAAQTIINCAGKFADRLNIEEYQYRNESRTLANIFDI